MEVCKENFLQQQEMTHITKLKLKLKLMNHYFTFDSLDKNQSLSSK